MAVKRETGWLDGSWPKDITMAEFSEMVRKADANDGRPMFPFPVTSPGGAAALLRVTRQRVHQLILSGQLKAVRVFDKSDTDAAYIFVDLASAEDYRRWRGTAMARKPRRVA